jgi:GT2 family glycosyltransferase
MIDLSIIIVNYNTFELTSKCIESVIRLTHGITYEIIVVDNASVERDPKEFKSVFPDVVVLANEKNLGFAGGNNLGIAQSKGQTILLLNSDAEVLSNVIGECYHKLYELDNKVKAISCKLIFPDGRIQPSCGRFPSVALQLMELFRLQKLLSKTKRGELFLGNFFDYNHAVYPDWVWGTFFMFKRDTLKLFREEKLSETYFLYMEDMEWCYHIQEAGGRIYFDPTHTVIHHRGSSTEPYFGENLNPTIKTNFIDLVERHEGILFAKLFFALVQLNTSVSRIMKKVFGLNRIND